MRLQRVRVQNYRSIVDSGIVEIEDRVTVLVGKNEQGKTTFLRALKSLNPDESYSAKDLPNHMRAALENTPAAEIPMIDAWFVVDVSDKAAFQGIIPDLPKVAGIRVSKSYDDEYAFASVLDDASEVPLEPRPPDLTAFIADIKQQAESLRGKIKAHAERLPAFAPSVEQAVSHIDALVAANFSDSERISNVIKTFGAALKGLPGQDAAIQEDLAHAIAGIGKANIGMQQALSHDFYAPIRTALPRFVFHSTTMDKVPDFVGIAEFVADAEGTSRGMANLCAVAGLSTQKIRDLAATTDAADRETFEDHYRSTISGGINEFWTQERYTVHFRIEATRLSVSVSDGSYTQRIPPSDRSDGFQWYLSFYSALLSEVSATDPMVLLLDNPGLELHANGQRDIKRFLGEKLPGPAQVIYVTHSAAMIDAFNLDEVRQVELLGDLRGTKVAKLAIKEGAEFDLLEPVRSAVGASLASSLILQELNVLVEGAADKPILDGAFASLRPTDVKRLLVNGSIAESNGLLPRFYQRGGLPLVVLVDADSGGRALKSSLLSWGIREEQIVELRTLFDSFGTADFELEDVISVDFYHSAVGAAYPEQQVDPPTAEYRGKRSKYYDKKFRDEHGIGFNKRRVGEAVRRLLVEGKADGPTLDSLRKVTDAIWAALQRQIGTATQNVAG